ncbi:hypothetical protein BpHYR1_034598 [Brachionus plicatilis]|uniref:Uncharacterized protein n=1 Tax=Brachionus plicatilis TaxID=10195 RepID=A0A3M7SZL3_BRAPC|nr:hypothetical protein BpHYR1_034598 [Brachionus plicatilis]
MKIGLVKILNGSFFESKSCKKSLNFFHLEERSSFQVILFIKDFNSFQQIQLTCYKPNLTNLITQFVIIPNREIVFSIDFSSMDQFVSKNLFVYLANIRAIDVQTFGFKNRVNKSLNVITLSYSKFIKYKANLCPFVFKESLSDAFLFRNTLTFLNVNVSFNSTIKCLRLFFYRYNLTMVYIVGQHN